MSAPQAHAKRGRSTHLTWHTVPRPTREMGLRAAPGASPSVLLNDSIWRGLRPGAIGITLGAAAVYPAVRVMQRALHQEFIATDGMLLGIVRLMVMAATAIAALVPVRRALRISPAMTVRA